MASDKYTLARLIDLASQMERKAYKFYDQLEKEHRSNKGFVDSLAGIKEDELLHLRVLTEIRSSLSDVRLASSVDEESVDKLEALLAFMDTVDVSSLKTADQIIDTIQRLEEVEFDIVMNFVKIDEINFAFTRDYLRNESIDHTNRIYRAQQHLD